MGAPTLPASSHMELSSWLWGMELFPFMVSEVTGQRTEVELCLAKVQTMGKMAKTAYISLAVSCWGNKVNYSMGTVSLNKEY